jgi:hypothetical protein
MSRRRPSGLGSNSRKFAEVRRPDGTADKVPAARDAATYLFLATEAGAWPERFFLRFLYESPSLKPGAVVELEEMRPGQGMGRVQLFRVLEVRTRVSAYPNGYGQLRRLVLVELLSTDPGLDEQGGD